MQQDGNESSTIIRVATLKRDGARDFRLEPGPDARAEMAQALGVSAVRKLRLDGQITPVDREDWRLEAHLGATVVQPCVVTLEPVTTRIEEPVARRFLAHPPELVDGAETEMPEDDSEEPLGDAIDLIAVMLEALSLALPAYPRADGAELGDVRVTEPGKTALSDADARPFAALKGLRDRLEGDAGDD